jgi:hypothetical protein
MSPATPGLRLPRRPLRSLMIGDTDRYFSPYIHGVAAGCGELGIWHSAISIRNKGEVIRERIRDVKPDLLWTHVLLWPPGDAPPAGSLLSMCADARANGALVMIHDGDVKGATRYPQDLSGAVDLALCNHLHDRSAWNVPALYWPYACFPQRQIADPTTDLLCDVAFAGQLGGGLYGGRTALVEALRQSGASVRVFDGTPATGGNTLLRTPSVAASATTVLGFGRPGQGEWVDTRVFQYPGAGGLLLHDDVREFLTPWEHYVPYTTGSKDSIVEALARVKAMTPTERAAFRLRAFAHGQEHHSYTARIRQVLSAVEW